MVTLEGHGAPEGLEAGVKGIHALLVRLLGGCARGCSNGGADSEEWALVLSPVQTHAAGVNGV